MRVFEGSADLGKVGNGCVLTVGNFDGLHLGHQALLQAVTALGREAGERSALFTFDPHPRQVLYPDRTPPRLMTREQLALGLERAGVDILIREPFTAEFASLAPEEFLGEVIGRRIQPTAIFVGRDFHFGRGRSGSGNTLERLGPELGCRVEIIPQVYAGGRDVSSTRIRSALMSGDVEDATLCLNRPYSIWGRVVPGDRRGRELGFPTANLESENELLPRRGVYATRTRRIEDGRPLGGEWFSVTNIGSRPTFDADRIVTETHLMDFDGDLYGARLEIAFCARIRDERRFESVSDLRVQIEHDVERARHVLSG
jgi:riboflavin kinase/FMN adenylyltransferase